MIGKVIGNVGAGQMFAVMAILHPLAAVVLWTMVRPEKPSNKLASPLNPQPV
ncbi:MAG: hypothetical protein ABIR24_15145 [Verrucomicrobiota bacterium]